MAKIDENIKVMMLKGADGAGIKDVQKTSTSGLKDTYTITLTDGTTSAFTVTNGKGISSIKKTGAKGLEDTYTIQFNDGTTSTFTVTNGKGISSIKKTGTSGLVDTYTITFNDGTTSTFTVTNGDSAYQPAVEALGKRIDNLILSRGYVTPEMFGAVGDGVTDDTIAINLAIQTEKAVLFSNKIYLLKDILIENKKVCLFGNSTTLKFADGTNNKKWISFVNCKDIIVTGFTFNGNRENQTIISSGPGNEYTENCPVILFDKTENAYVYNCYFYNCQGDGIQIDKLYYNQEATAENLSQNIHIYNNKFEKIGRNGISVCHCDGCLIENNIFENIKLFSSTIACGVDIEPNSDYHFITENIKVSNNLFYNCLFGVNVSISSLYAKNIEILNNNINSNSDDDEFGIYLVNNDEIKNIVISGNTVENLPFGIFSTSLYNCIISNNNFSVKNKVASTSGGGIGIYVNTLTDSKIIDNNIISNGIYSIMISVSTNNIISKNILEGNNSAGYTFLFDIVLNTTISKNEVNDNKIPLFLRNRAENNKIVNNSLLGKVKEITINNGVSNLIYNNFIIRKSVQKNFTSTVYDYEYTGLSITVPANSVYDLVGKTSWQNTEPVGCIFSTSNSIKEQVSYDGKNFTSISGYTENEITFYLWCRYANLGENPCVIQSNISS